MMTPLKFYRIFKGLTISDLARKVNMSISMLSKIEKGTTCGSKVTRVKISKTLKVPERNLFGGK